MVEVVIFIGILTLLTFASGYFSGSETALFSLSPMRTKSYRTDPNPKRRLIFELLQQPRDLLVTVFMLNTLVNILIQNVASHMFGAEAGWDLKVGVPLLITLFLGEIIPKTICMQHNVAVSDHVILSINFFHRLLASIRKVTVAVTHPISRLLFFYLEKEESISKEELQHVLETSEKHGVLHTDESVLVRGYLKLQKTTVKEMMTPKEDILFYEINEPLSKLVYLLVDQECSRLPVCCESIDNVLGIIEGKQFFLYGNRFQIGKDVRKILKKPFFVPETTQARVLMRQFDESDQVIALVVNEYGSISGLVTREDIAEIVIGDISDRRDQKPLYSVAGKREIIASGKLELADFNRLFHTNFASSSNMVTIGGWLIEQLGEIPKGGTTYESHHFLFQVLAADANRIRRLYIRKLKKPINDEELNR
ncbi:MAG: hemolysin family protein [Waddliaceae bacterium]